VIALVGPTGVGKTTTLLKMATNPQIFGRRNVAFISADTYRIGAVEQLRTFSSIARVPLSVVYSPTDISQALQNFGNQDLILIDTTGRSQNKPDHMIELRQFMQRASPDEIHLVLSATTKYKDILDIIQKFDSIGANRIAFTKLDETKTVGTMLNVSHYVKKPISYLTDGQNVPGDIALAKANRIADMIMSGRCAA
jgi:flagellar biosynthesis protein FlhF